MRRKGDDEEDVVADPLHQQDQSLALARKRTRKRCTDQHLDLTILLCSKYKVIHTLVSICLLSVPLCTRVLHSVIAAACKRRTIVRQT